MWIIWITVGILCLIVEIITPGFFFFSIGGGAITTGITARFISNMPIQVVIFAISTLISFILMKRFSKYLLKNEAVNSNIFALPDKIGVVSKIILPNKKGYVKIEGEEWSAISSSPTDTIPEGSQVKVLQLEGNKLVVTIQSEEV